MWICWIAEFRKGEVLVCEQFFPSRDNFLLLLPFVLPSLSLSVSLSLTM